MAKKSQKRSPRLRKENSSCMGGLISMFDFRQGRSTQRLLSDKKCRVARNLGASYSSGKDDLQCNREENHGDAENLTKLSDTEADKVNLGLTSIKALMEEEMSRAHFFRKESSSKIEGLKAELELEGNAEKSHSEQAKNSSVGSDDHAHDLNISTKLISQQSDFPNISEVLTSDIDVAAFMVDYCSNSFQFKENQLQFKNKRDQTPSQEDLKKSELVNDSVTFLQKAIVDISMALLKQKSTNSSKFSGNTEVEEEFKNALKMLNSNKDIFLKLLGDPDSPIRKHIEDLQNVHIGEPSKIDENQKLWELRGSKQPQKQRGHHFFRKGKKLTVANQSNECSDAKVVNRIVVLKPSLVRNQTPSNTVSSTSSIQSQRVLENKEDGERLSSHFSLREIKRRFRNVVGTSRKEGRLIAMDGVLHRIPYGRQISSKNEIYCRREAIETGDEQKSNTKEIQKKNEVSFSTNNFSQQKKLNKNAAPQMLYREAAFYDEARRHLSELLRMESEGESLPAIQVSKSLGRILSFPGFNYLSPRISPAREKDPESPREKTSVFLCHSSQNFDTKYSTTSRPRESFPNTNESQEAKNGSMEITEVEDCMQIEEGSQVEAQIVSISNEDNLPSEIFKEEGSSILLEPVNFEEMFQPSTPTASSSAVLQDPRDTECAIDNTGRPSPISVLEPLYFEDLSSPASLKTELGTNAERNTQPSEPQIGSSEASSSSIDSEANTITCMEFDEASLFDEMEISYGSLINDPKFLFDSIDEVVTEIKERHCSCTPWVSLIRPSISPLQKQKDFINEAHKRIKWHLDVQFPVTLGQTVKKDFDGGAWFHLELEAEDAVNEIGNEILDYLFEETALELWD